MFQKDKAKEIKHNKWTNFKSSVREKVFKSPEWVEYKREDMCYASP